MAFKIQRKNRIKEDLELSNADGKTALVIHVDLNVDEIQNRAIKAYENLGKAQNELQEAPISEAAMEAYGKAVGDLFAVVFGEEDAAKIVEFYEGSYGEMLVDLLPFFSEYVMPAIHEASEDRVKKLRDAERATKRLFR